MSRKSSSSSSASSGDGAKKDKTKKKDKSKKKQAKKESDSAEAVLATLGTLDFIMLRQPRSIKAIDSHKKWHNKFQLHINDEAPILFAGEVDKPSSRFLMGANRPFEIDIVDYAQNNCIKVIRPGTMNAVAWCGAAIRDQVLVESPKKEKIGTVRQLPGTRRPHLEVLDSGDVKLFEIVRPEKETTKKWIASQEFEVRDAQGKAKLSSIIRSFAACAEKRHTDADEFFINFPPNVNRDSKAVLLAATFLLEYMFFEHSNNHSTETAKNV
ncbi:hypothetical protein Ciccas_000313 [Cichlidogyrus casuarinus]|uniref:Phospholipid scramblase n=1 Tax=Cichlidogyrus casuarinus TaxID=1844966 RepID=A0ABD2QR80_9PLAT